MTEAYHIASDKAGNNARSGKNQYDKKAKSTVLHPGDRLLIRNVKERGGRGKGCYWKDHVYKIVRQKYDDIPVYELIPENDEGKIRVVHKNMLLPCAYLSVDKPVTTSKQVIKKKTKPKRDKKKLPSEEYSNESKDESEMSKMSPEQIKKINL